MKEFFIGLCLVGILIGANCPVFADCRNDNRFAYHQRSVSYYVVNRNDPYYYNPPYYPQVNYYPAISYYSPVRYYQPYGHYNRWHNNRGINVRLRLF